MPRKRAGRQGRKTAGANVHPAYERAVHRLADLYRCERGEIWEAAVLRLLRKQPEEVRDAIRWAAASYAVDEVDRMVGDAMEQHETEEDGDPAEPAGR